MNKIYTREEMLEELKKDKNLRVFIGFFVSYGYLRSKETGEGLIDGSYQALKGWAAKHSTTTLKEFYKVDGGFASKFIYELLKDLCDNHSQEGIKR